jgi:hypothetical protein
MSNDALRLSMGVAVEMKTILKARRNVRRCVEFFKKIMRMITFFIKMVDI